MQMRMVPLRTQEHHEQQNASRSRTYVERPGLGGKREMQDPGNAGDERGGLKDIDISNRRLGKPKAKKYRCPHPARPAIRIQAPKAGIADQNP